MMKQRLLSLTGIVMVLFLVPGNGQGQTISLIPNAIPNGIASASGEQYHQRFDIHMGAGAIFKNQAFTITLPADVTYVTGSATGVTNGTGDARFSNQSAGQNVIFNTSGIVASQVFTVEFDVTTPAAFAGIATGTKADAVYACIFQPETGSNVNVPVAKHQNLRIQDVYFTAPLSRGPTEGPDSPHGDTTSAGGRFYKLEFPSALPDYSHTTTSGAVDAGGRPDTATDIAYTFYLSTDSTLVKRPLTLAPVSFFALLADPPSGPNLSGGGDGSRQNPRLIPATYIREDFTTAFSTNAADSVNGVISLAGTQDNTVYYVYALADPAQGRDPATWAGGAANTGGAKKGFDPTTLGAFSGGVFLGRSGPLLVKHPPEFVIAGWDYDDDGNDDFEATGVIQVASDINGMVSVLTNVKDNRNITVDTGLFEPKGTTLSTLGSGGSIPKAISTVSMLFLAEDADDPNNFQMNIILSTNSGLGVAELSGDGIASFDVASSFRVPGTDTLTTNHRSFSFDPITRDPVTSLITSFIPANTYNVYYVATDGTNRTVYQVSDDPFSTSPAYTTLTVAHSPNIAELDSYSLNDFGGDNDLDVVTGIDISQMYSTAVFTGGDDDGKNLSAGPAQRYVNIHWGGQGLDADIDVDDNATIDFYYSTRSDFNGAGKSLGHTPENSDGSDLLAAVAQGNNDTHLIGRTTEDPDGKFDDNFQWDLWTYVSPENTIPRSGVKYFIYALMNGGSTRRLVSFTEDGSTTLYQETGVAVGVNFQHPPYARVIEPSQDVTVSVDEPLNVIWEAVDVDNGILLGAAPANGRSAPNSRLDSPNLRILLSSIDLGEVTTWATLTSTVTQVNGSPPELWLANSTSGALADEIELNEGVDTAFVIQGNRMASSILNNGVGTKNLETNGGFGTSYYIYLAIDSGNTGTVAAQGDFDSFSVAVRAPGRVTFTGVAPDAAPSIARFITPTRLTAVSEELIKFPIIPDDGSATTSVEIVNIFLTVDATLFDAVDQDPVTAGIQPFTLGPNTVLSAANVSQAAYIDVNTGDLRLDFTYDVAAGLTFFDGQQILALANLRAKSITGGATAATTITLDNSGTRVSKMIDLPSTLGTGIPAPTQVDIVRRANVTGTVPLQGRPSSADTVTFVLREIGDFVPVSDSVFEAANDTDPNTAGVQVVSTGVNGDFTLSSVPTGRFVLTARVPRHLAGHDTLIIEGGLAQDVSGLQPTLDGAGVDRTELLAGDAAGFNDSTGASIPDNFIDGDDISAINGSLFLQLGETGFDTFADINRDKIVNAADRAFATANTTNNTGVSGIKPVYPTFKQAVATAGDNAEARLLISGYPTEEVNAGEVFDVTVAIEGAAAIRTYEFHLGFDPSKLAVEDVVPGSLFENYSADMAGKVREGDFGMVNSILGLTPVGASGEATLATIRFRAISRSSETMLELTDALLIDVDHEGAKPELAGEAMIVLSSKPIVYHDAAGQTIHGLVLADADPKVDFNDFVAFAQSFGTSAGMEAFDLRADFNGDDSVNFADFLMLSQSFGKIAVDAPSAKRAGKSVAPAGANGDATMTLKVDGEARMGEMLTLNAQIGQAQALTGWGLTVQYDPTRFEFVEAAAPEGNLLQSAGASDPLFLVHSDTPGEVTLASAVGGNLAASGEGNLAQLVFRPIGEFEDATFDIANGIVFDPSQLTNPVGVAEVLEVRAIPSAFALNQNFPNPFNPQTTISYDLAEAGQVHLQVYNVMGQLVKSLVSENQPAGRYQVVWSGNDAVGRQVASGIYFYRLNTSGFKAVRKLMLLK
jgi:hypothetical protein